MDKDDFESMATFRERVREAVEEAVQRHVRQLTLVDPDFAAWPLDEPAWLDALTRFVHLPQRHVVMIGGSFDGVQLHQPRFTRWRRTYAHAVQPLAPQDGIELPTLLLAGRELVVRVLERDRWRARVILDRQEAHQWADQIDALAQRCGPTFSATTLGL
jgi:hypothetical protein